MSFKTLRSDRELVIVHSSDLHIEHDYMGSPYDRDPAAGLSAVLSTAYQHGADVVLLAGGVPTPAAHLLSNHYNQTRAEYYRQLDRASKSGGDILPFVEYATRGFVEGLREQLGMIRDQQWDVTWENYVHDIFREKNSTSR